jgi:hypothetical protein
MKAKSAFDKKADKQKQVRKKLEEARARNAFEVSSVVIHGNRFVLDLISGKHLASGIERFPLTGEEIRLIQARLESMELRKRCEDFRSGLRRSSGTWLPLTIKELHELGLVLNLKEAHGSPPNFSARS